MALRHSVVWRLYSILVSLIVCVVSLFKKTCRILPVVNLKTWKKLIHSSLFIIIFIFLHTYIIIITFIIFSFFIVFFFFFTFYITAKLHQHFNSRFLSLNQTFFFIIIIFQFFHLHFIFIFLIYSLFYFPHSLFIFIFLFLCHKSSFFSSFQ